MEQRTTHKSITDFAEISIGEVSVERWLLDGVNVPHSSQKAA
jgi:hypothetical protein